MAIFGLGKKKRSAAPKQKAKPAVVPKEQPEAAVKESAPKSRGGRLVFRVRGPWISEKGTRLAAQNQYVFLVEPDANKNEISKEIEERYGVTVQAVQTVRYAGKRKYFRNLEGSRPQFKKAYVTLKSGQTIDAI